MTGKVFARTLADSVQRSRRRLGPAGVDRWIGMTAWGFVVYSRSGTRRRRSSRSGG